MEIRTATGVAEVTAAGHLFDNPVRSERAERFLTTAGHHLLPAQEQGAVVGFVSGVETVHAGKRTEMFLYELAVAEPYRRGGIGRALVQRPAAPARERGCYGMWVGVEADDDIALAACRGAGGESEEPCAC